MKDVNGYLFSVTDYNYYIYFTKYIPLYFLQIKEVIYKKSPANLVMRFTGDLYC